MLSIVIPVYNEVESLDELLSEITEVATAEGYEWEVVFVDDGSRDGSWDKIQQIAAVDEHVRGLRFRRNFGKAAALSAGFQTARGDVVVTLDADLQDDPHELPRLLAALGEEKDVISGYKQRRLDPWHKVYPSRVFNWMVSRLTGVQLHDHNCGMKCYRREVLDEVRLYGEMHRFVPVLAAARGFRVGELVINHRPRQHGYSKYGVRRFVKGFLDLLTVKFLTGFGQRPQHLLGTIGLVCFLVGSLGMTYLSGYWIAAQLFPEWGLVPLHQRPLALYSVAALLLGAQMVTAGLIGEMLTALGSRETDSYSISEQTTRDREGPQEVLPLASRATGSELGRRPAARPESDSHSA